MERDVDDTCSNVPIMVEGTLAAAEAESDKVEQPKELQEFPQSKSPPHDESHQHKKRPLIIKSVTRDKTSKLESGGNDEIQSSSDNQGHDKQIPMINVEEILPLSDNPDRVSETSDLVSASHGAPIGTDSEVVAASSSNADDGTLSQLSGSQVDQDDDQESQWSMTPTEDLIFKTKKPLKNPSSYVLSRVDYLLLVLFCRDL